MMPHDAEIAIASTALGSFLVTLQPLPLLLEPHESPPLEPHPDEPLELPHESPLEPQPEDDDELLLAHESLLLPPHESPLLQLEPDELLLPPLHESPLLSLEQLPVSLLGVVVVLESQLPPLPSLPLSHDEPSEPQPDWSFDDAQPLEQVSELPQLPPLQSQVGDTLVLLLQAWPQLGETSRGGSCEGGITPPSTPIGFGKLPLGAPKISARQASSPSLHDESVRKSSFAASVDSESAAVALRAQLGALPAVQLLTLVIASERSMQSS
jgi:hypothetical protein